MSLQTKHIAFFALVPVLCCTPTADAKDIVVGQSTALSGALSTSGIPMRLGAQAYFDWVNASGGVNGQKIRFVSKDDQYQVDETVRNVRELVERDAAVVLVGGSGTANNEALLNEKVLANSNIAMVGPRTGSASLRQPFNPYIFHMRASYAQEVDKAIGYFMTINAKKIGIVYQDDAFGKDGLLAAKLALKHIGAEPSMVARYERNSTHVEDAVKSVMADKPQAVLLLTTTAPTAAFVKLYRNAGGTAHLMALSVNDADAIVKLIGLEVAHGLTITTVFPSLSRIDYPIVKEFQQALNRFGPPGAQASQVSFEGYLVARVIVEALKNSGENPTRAQVLRSLGTLGSKDFGGFRVDFGPNMRAGSNYVDISFIGRNGNLLR